MKRLPSPEENPNGLHSKYDVKKIYGNTDSAAFYFVLRLDHKQEEVPRQVQASRRAALLYASIVEKTAPKLAAELREAVYGLIEVEVEGSKCQYQPDEVVIGGSYSHTKSGNEYIVTSIAIDTDTGDKRVSYTRLEGGDRRVWSRRYDEFVEQVNLQGLRKPRFQFVQMCDWNNADRMIPTEDTNQFQLGFDLEIRFDGLKDRNDLFKFLEELDQFLMTLGLVDEAGSGNHNRWVSHIAHRGGNYFDATEKQLKQVVRWCDDQTVVLVAKASELKNLWESSEKPHE